MYSIADGIATSEQYVNRAKQLNIKALGIADHGNCYGWIAHTKACIEGGIKPIIGIEAYVLDQQDMTNAEGKVIKTEGDNPKDSGGHAVIIVLNQQGYSNLMHLIKDSYSHFHRHARISSAELFKHNEGLLVTTACVGGIFNKLLHSEKPTDIDINEADRRFDVWYKVFGDRLKGEVQPAYNDVQRECNRWVERHFDMSNIWCATDTHYVMPGDNVFQSTIKAMVSESYKGYEDYYYLWPYDDLVTYDDIKQEYVDNTNQLLELVDFQIKLDTPMMPDVILPMGRNNHMLPNTYDTYLYQLAFDGLKRRKPGYSYTYAKRLLYELQVMKDNHTASYLLMNYQIFKRLREQGIVYGPRGSACGSLVAYCLYLHDIDPLEHNIMFERFMTPGRKSLPDIDYDFYTPDREIAFKTLKEMYGDDSVSRIATFNRLRLKSSLLKIGKRYEINAQDIKACSDAVKYGAEEGSTSFAQMKREMNKKAGRDLLEEIKRKDGNSTKWLEDVERVCELNLPISQGIHACGCVITSKERPVNMTWPVLYKDGDMAVQYDMEDIEAAGGVKIDFLGLSSLYPINTMLRLLELKASQIPLDDPEVYKFIQHDSMFGLFQAKNYNMKKLIRDIKPTQLSDLALAVAAFRPAVLTEGLHERYINRKNGTEAVEYPHPDLEPVLKGTYGVFIYQDHILGACKTIGMTDMEADKVRKATAKKKPEEVKKLKKMFEEKARSHGWDGISIDRVWDIIKAAAGYGFNFSHALSYARWLYISAWIKMYYPDIFFSASLTARQNATFNEDEGELFRELLLDCRKYAPNGSCITLLPPNINNASHEFIYNEIDNTMTFAIAGIKNVNAEIALWLRENGPFTSLEQLMEKSENSKARITTFSVPVSKIIKRILNISDKQEDDTPVEANIDEIPEEEEQAKPKAKAKRRIKEKTKFLKMVRNEDGSRSVEFDDISFPLSHDRYAAYVMGCSTICINYINIVGAMGYVSLCHTSYKQIVSHNHIDSLIKAGALDNIGDRRRMLEKLFFERVSEKKDSKFMTAKERSEFRKHLKTLGWTQDYYLLYYDKDQQVQNDKIDKSINDVLKKVSKKLKKYREQFNDLDKIRHEYSGYISHDYGGDTFMDVDYNNTLTVHGVIKNCVIDKEAKNGSYFHSFVIDSSSGEIKCMVWSQFTEECREYIEKGKKVAVTGRKKLDKFNSNRQIMDAYSMKELEDYQCTNQYLYNDKNNKEE